jgi:hypothetical protein
MDELVGHFATTYVTKTKMYRTIAIQVNLNMINNWSIFFIHYDTIS